MEVVGMVGVVGFDTDRMRFAFEMHDVQPEEKQETFEKVQLLEEFFTRRFQRETKSGAGTGGGKGGDRWLNMS